jgi:hypothetical protein
VFSLRYLLAAAIIIIIIIVWLIELAFIEEGMHMLINVAKPQELIHCREINECRITPWDQNS